MATRTQIIRWLQYRGLSKLNMHINAADLVSMNIEELNTLYKKSGGKTKVNFPAINISKILMPV